MVNFGFGLKASLTIIPNTSNGIYLLYITVVMLANLLSFLRDYLGIVIVNKGMTNGISDRQFNRLLIGRVLDPSTLAKDPIQCRFRNNNAPA